MKLFFAVIVVFVVSTQGSQLDENVLDLQILSDNAIPADPEACVEYVRNMAGNRGITEVTINRCYNGGFARTKTNCPELECPNKCVLPMLDGNGCRTSCACKKSGVLGDIMLTEENVAALESGYANRAGYKFGGKWDNMKTIKNGQAVNNVYFTFASSLNEKARSAIQEAFHQLNEDTNGCFEYQYVYPGYEGPYIEFFSGDGCYSFPGRQVDYGKQELSIGKGCEYKGIVMHEIMHSLGFFHEQARPDRDAFVKIHWNNIERENHDQFVLMPANYIDSYGSPYDIDSIMQYGGYDFSLDFGVLPTITVRATNEPVSGQREYYTKEDIYQLKSMYKCQS